MDSAIAAIALMLILWIALSTDSSNTYSARKFYSHPEPTEPPERPHRPKGQS